MAYGPREVSASLAPVRWRWIPAGDLGTLATVWTMRDLAHAAAARPDVRALARGLREEIESVSDAASVLRAWLAARVLFQPDPAWEQITEPVTQLASIARTGTVRGDCDDAATLAATLALAMGLHARFVVLGFSSPGAPYRHVYTEVWTPHGWRDLDVTRSPGVRPRIARVLRVEV